jgi:hypothetical protein
VSAAGAPAISIVVASYARGHALRHAIESVQAQTYPDWELIVVDDASPDDTLEVVEGIGDRRVRTVALPRNHGEQSRPNNIGVEVATAPTIAFLNQDDLWFPDHLRHLVDLRERTGARLVWSALAIDLRGGLIQGEYTPEWLLRGWRDHYDVLGDAPASGWLLDRSLHLQLGGWRDSWELYGAPSQDFLFRAWRAGAPMLGSGRLSVVAEGSGNRKGSYVGGADRWQAAMLPRLLDDPASLRRDLAVAARPMDTGPDWRGQGARAAVRAACRRVRAEATARRGVSPYDLSFRIAGQPRGSWLAGLRRTRGLEAQPPAAPSAGGGRIA